MDVARADVLTAMFIAAVAAVSGNLPFGESGGDGTYKVHASPSGQHSLIVSQPCSEGPCDVIAWLVQQSEARDVETPCRFGADADSLVNAKELSWAPGDEFITWSDGGAVRRADFAQACYFETKIRAPRGGPVVMVRESCHGDGCRRSARVATPTGVRGRRSAACRHAPQDFDGINFTSLGASVAPRVQIDWAPDREAFMYHSEDGNVVGVFDLTESCDLDALDGRPELRVASNDGVNVCALSAGSLSCREITMD